MMKLPEYPMNTDPIPELPQDDDLDEPLNTPQCRIGDEPCDSCQ